jgi:hypothetical protein
MNTLFRTKEHMHIIERFATSRGAGRVLNYMVAKGLNLRLVTCKFRRSKLTCLLNYFHISFRAAAIPYIIFSI